MKPDPLVTVRKVCLGLPGATEKVAWGAPTFRVKDRLFAMYANNHHGDGRIALWVKAPVGEQDVLVDAHPERFFVPPYVGPSGWVGVRLDRGIAREELAAIVEAGYRMVAPKKLLEAPPAEGKPARKGRASAPAAPAAPAAHATKKSSKPPRTSKAPRGR